MRTTSAIPLNDLWSWMCTLGTSISNTRFATSRSTICCETRTHWGTGAWLLASPALSRTSTFWEYSTSLTIRRNSFSNPNSISKIDRSTIWLSGSPGVDNALTSAWRRTRKCHSLLRFISGKGSHSKPRRRVSQPFPRLGSYESIFLPIRSWRALLGTMSHLLPIPLLTLLWWCPTNKSGWVCLMSIC